MPQDEYFLQAGRLAGYVISPLLANLFLHYAFDKWMDRYYKDRPFERYADDIVCHCRTMKEACHMKEVLQWRLQSVGLSINDKKSRIVYIDTFKRYNVETCFTFLGYDFKVRTLRKHNGVFFRKFMPGASKKAMKNITQTIKEWRIHRSTTDDARDIANRYNATLRGWINYYGLFLSRNFRYRLWIAFQSRLIKWAQGRYKCSCRKTERKINQLRKAQPDLFAHWYLLRASNA